MSLDCITLFLVALIQAPDALQEPPSDGYPSLTNGVLELTLDDAIRIAMRNNLDVQLEQSATQIAEYDLFGSWGAFDPTFSITGSWEDRENVRTSDLAPTSTENSLGLDSSLSFPLTSGGSFDFSYRRDNRETNNPFVAGGSGTVTNTSDVLSVSYRQPLLRGAWKRFATVDQRERDVAYRLQVEREREVRQSMLLSVHQAYWDLVAAQEQLGVRELALKLGLEQLSQDQRRLEVGVGTEVDVLQAETNVATQREQRLLAEVNLRAAMDNLKSIIFHRQGDDWEQFLGFWNAPIAPQTPLPFVDEELRTDWVQSLARAIENRSELSQQRFEIDNAEVRLQRARSNKMAGLDLALTATSVAFEDKAREAAKSALRYEFPAYSASLSFDLPLGNRTATYAERSARSAVRNAVLTYDRLEQTVVSGVRSAVRDMDYQRQAVAAAETSRDLAERQLKAEQARYREGLSTTFQVLEFQRDLAEALSSEKAARANYAKALATLVQAEGWLGEPEPR